MSASRTEKPPVSSQTQAAFFFAPSLFTLLKVRPNELIEWPAGLEAREKLPGRE